MSSENAVSVHSAVTNRSMASCASSAVIKQTTSQPTPREVLLLSEACSKNLKVFCSLCNQVFNEPYIASCGHTFCLGCVSADTKVNCPQDGVALSLLVKNLVVADEVGQLMVHCRYGCRLMDPSSGEYEVDTEGCPVILRLSDRVTHELECEFSIVSCPNAISCGPMLRKDLAAHLSSCTLTPCPHSKYNCGFNGTLQQLEEHLQTCDFEGLKGVLAEMEGQVRSLRGDMEDLIGGLRLELEGKHRHVQELTSSLAEMTEKMVEAELSNQTATHRIVALEEQQSNMETELTKVKSTISKISSDMKHLQSGVDGDSDPRHQFVCQGTFVGHKGPLWDLCKNGDLLFSASSDNTIKVWNLSNMYRGPTTLTGHDGIVLAVCTQGDFLFSGSSDNTIKVWNVRNSRNLELIHTIKGHNDPVCTLTCTENLLFSGSLKTIKVWNMHSHEHEQVKTLPSQNHWVRALVARGKHLYSGSYQAVKIWSLETLEVVHVLQCVGASVYSLAITDRHIICGTYENLIHVWDVHTLQEIGTLSGHVGIVYSLAVLKAPGNMRLFSASYDKTIRVWNMELMTCGQILARHEGSVTCVLAASGRVFSGAVDSTLKVWQ